MKILGIETSFDETAAAIVKDGKTILTNVVASSAQMHQKYGGVVPEVAARKQIESMIPVLDETLVQFAHNQQFNHLTMKQFIKSIDAIAITIGPGLIGSLLVGVETAKTLAYAWNKPIIPVNHVLAHIYGAFLKEESNSQLTTHNSQLVLFPAIALVVSGAHTELYLMTNERTLKWLGGTLDDAAGECFDKCARLLGLPYPGGPEIAAEAAKLTTHNPQLTTKLPRPMIKDDTLNFSFSGLKTAVLREWKKLTTHNSQLTTQFAYEIQEAITDVLVAKTLAATGEYKARSIIVTGGVAANQRLSQKFYSQLKTHLSAAALAKEDNLQLFIPPPYLCIDSAAYIAAYAFYHNKPVAWKNITARPDLSVEV